MRFERNNYFEESCEMKRMISDMSTNIQTYGSVSRLGKRYVERNSSSDFSNCPSNGKL